MLSQQNANLAKGQLADGNMTADILANDQLLKAADYKNLIVAIATARPSGFRISPTCRTAWKISARPVF
jgi:multidrug efflux pump subunit AcrB